MGFALPADWNSDGEVDIAAAFYLPDASSTGLLSDIIGIFFNGK